MTADAGKIGWMDEARKNVRNRKLCVGIMEGRREGKGWVELAGELP